jgi:hypothetical protein
MQIRYLGSIQAMWEFNYFVWLILIIHQYFNQL